MNWQIVGAYYLAIGAILNAMVLCGLSKGELEAPKQQGAWGVCITSFFLISFWIILLPWYWYCVYCGRVRE